MDRPMLPKRGSFTSHSSDGSAYDHPGLGRASRSPYRTKAPYRAQYGAYDGSSPFSRSTDGGFLDAGSKASASSSPYLAKAPYGGAQQGFVPAAQAALLPPLHAQQAHAQQPYMSRAYQPQPALWLDSHSVLYGGDWSPDNLVAVSTFNEEPTNYIHVVQADTEGEYAFSRVADALVAMPQTKVLWEPAGGAGPAARRLVSAGDTLRLWTLDAASSSLAVAATMTKRTKSQSGNSPAPLTSADWNTADPNIVITSSIDTTCTVWDLAKQAVSTQLIAHDREVFDVAFLPHSLHQFVSTGADGSARLFDLRALDNSTIIFEPEAATPLLRVAPSPSDANTLAVIGQDSNAVAIVDIRAARNPVRELEAHQAPVNSVRWLPQSPGVLVSGGDDCQILLWNVASGSLVGALSESMQINNVLASPDGKWLGALFGKSLQGISTQMV